MVGAEGWNVPIYLLFIEKWECCLIAREWGVNVYVYSILKQESHKIILWFRNITEKMSWGIFNLCLGMF